MRALAVLSLALIVLMGSCKKDDDGPKFTSAAGDWKYTTPDNHITIGFTLVQNANTWEVKNPTISVDNVSGNAEVMYDGINPPAIGSIRINANDVGLVYAWAVELNSATVSSDFTQITAQQGTYTYPQNHDVSISSAVIVRK